MVSFQMPHCHRRRTFGKVLLAILTLVFGVLQFWLLLAASIPEVAMQDNEGQGMVQDLRDFSTSQHDQNVGNVNTVGKKGQEKATKIPSHTLTEQHRLPPLRLPKPDVGVNANTATAVPATFHGIPLAYVPENRPSVVHCVGENFLPSAWFYRSCQFRHLCFDTTTTATTATEEADSSQEGFVIFQSASQERATAAFNTHETLSPYARSSTNFQQAVSSMGKSSVGKEQSKWFPRTVPFHANEHTNATDGKVVHQGYYALPDHIVWAPFATTQPSLTDATSHLLMDYVFPIFNLLSMFGLEDRSLLLTTLHHNNQDHNQDCASAEHCSDTFRSILPLMKLARGHAPLYPTGRIVRHPTDTGTGTGTDTDTDTGLWSGLVCARYGVAGIGALTDHGTKQHGELATDYHSAQNTGRGPLFFAFRAYVLHNLNLTPTSMSNNNASTSNTANTKATTTMTRTRTRHTMTVAVSASAKSGLQHFRKQQEALSQLAMDHNVLVQEQEMSQLTLRQQIEWATQSTFYLSVMGEGAVPALFMPRGATLILYYNNRDELVQGGSNKGKRKNSSSQSNNATVPPAMMDWDLWNNLSHLRVHWLPLQTMNDPKDLQVLVDLMRNEIDYLSDRDTLDRREREHEREQQTRTHSTVPTVPADGNFSGLNVRYVDRARSSAVHCVGDNFVPNRAFYYRSCEIQHLCMDTEYPTKHFVISPSPLQMKLNESIAEWNQDYAVVSSVMDTGVMEGRPVRFADDAWFPSATQLSAGFYELPSDVVWIPFTAEYSHAKNPGHLMWDYFLPFYSLLSMYGMEDKRLLLTSIDSLCMFLSDCKKVVTKFLPLMGTSAQELVQQDLVAQGEQRSSRVCARHGATGIGMLTDHGFTRHGQNIGDYKRMHNAGRGSMLYAFRGFLLRNMKIEEEEGVRRHSRRRISFSINSSTNPFRRKDFSEQISAVNDAFPNTTEVEVKAYEMAGLTLEEQIECVMDTSVFVSVIGGSTSIASFLPRGSTLILYFNDENSFVGNTRKKDMPTMMDFDFWNNAAYVRVHWLPTGSMDGALGVQTLVRLIQNELSIADMIE